jgi:multidrug efflux pump
MYLLGYSLDNLSLMALTISTGFVVDDAIVVMENITRHIEAGMPRFQATLQGAREVGFTVLSMSLSLIAVFIPILLMGGIIGRYFHEFAVTLSVAILVSLLVSLTTTPMLCARWLRRPSERQPGRIGRISERSFTRLLYLYRRSLGWALSHPRTMMIILLGALCLNFYLYAVVPKGFFPQQDTGRIMGGIQADQSISFQAMRQKLTQFISIVQKDPAVDTVTGFTGGGQTNGGFVFIRLKDRAQRGGVTSDQVIARLRRELNQVPGASLFLQSAQDVRVGGRQSNAQYQYTLQGDDLDELYTWVPKITAALQSVPELTDVNSDQQQKGLEIDLVIDRTSAARLGITASQIDNTLYDAFGQRQVSTIFNPLNQYHVVMEVAPRFWQDPQTLNDIYVSTAGTVTGTNSTNALAGTTGSPSRNAGTANLSLDAVRNQRTNSLAAIGHGSASTGAAVSTSPETMVPLAAVSHFGPGNTPLAVNHQGTFVASTISFNVAPGKSLSAATAAINDAMMRIGVPNTIHGTFQGTARVFQQSLSSMPILILAAIIAIYIVLGILYESYVHPLTILSTLPSAGVGAVLALLAFRTEFDIIALIGVILLIGIVKKNAIMMIDFALETERENGRSPRDAIYQACLLRFRPIMMTTMAALLGALPLAVGMGEGSEIRHPLGISIIGGLIVSQLLTLYTTPVIYLYLDRFRLWALARFGRGAGDLAGGDRLKGRA